MLHCTGHSLTSLKGCLPLSSCLLESRAARAGFSSVSLWESGAWSSRPQPQFSVFLPFGQESPILLPGAAFSSLTPPGLLPAHASSSQPQFPRLLASQSLLAGALLAQAPFQSCTQSQCSKAELIGHSWLTQGPLALKGAGSPGTLPLKVI